MAFEVISPGLFFLGLAISFGLFAAAVLIAKFVKIRREDSSMVPPLLKGLMVGFLAVFGTIGTGMTIGFGCANPDYYEDTVEGPEESDYAADMVEEADGDSDNGGEAEAQ